LSFFEAAAYAEWAQARLPTEFEWETAAGSASPAPSADDAGALPDPHPRPLDPAAARADGLQQLFGTAWQWTRSSYDPYPGFRPWSGAIGEYNGKFMIGQLVLRGSSCATPAGHSRISYRNFFPPAARWQFAGLRLARDIQRP
jgi:formylglycine-generating enzyme required for sulfatase activity